MPKGSNQKLKLLFLAQILQQETDERHPLTTGQLSAALARHGIASERKSLYDDITTLCSFGMDIITVRGRSNAYYLGERAFQIPEVKLLVDAVQSAKFITEGKSRELIKKICGLASHHEAALMQRQVHVQGRAKTVNERTYYSVDAIQTAIAQNRQISFQYFEWVVDPKSPHLYTRRPKRDGAAYQVSPWSLLWDDEYYYLLAYDAAAAIIKHYRVDKMADITEIPLQREGRAGFDALDIAEYSKSIFGMFGGQEADVRIRFANRLIGVVVDRFGSDIIIHPSGSEHFVITIKAIVSPQFLSWVFGFGSDAEVLAPSEVVSRITDEISKISALYKNHE